MANQKDDNERREREERERAQRERQEREEREGRAGRQEARDDRRDQGVGGAGGAGPANARRTDRPTIPDASFTRDPTLNVPILRSAEFGTRDKEVVMQSTLIATEDTLPDGFVMPSGAVQIQRIWFSDVEEKNQDLIDMASAGSKAEAHNSSVGADGIPGNMQEVGYSWYLTLTGDGRYQNQLVSTYVQAPPNEVVPSGAGSQRQAAPPQVTPPPQAPNEPFRAPA